MIWQKGMDILMKTYELTSNFPATEKFGMTSQANRAALSTPSNIAEGSSRKSAKEYRHYLEIALGSQFELETALLAAQGLKYSSATRIQDLLLAVMEEQKMIASFLNKLEA